jgi:hypothetical protein
MVRAGVWDLRRSVAMDYFGLPVFEEFWILSLKKKRVLNSCCD